MNVQNGFKLNEKGTNKNGKQNTQLKLGDTKLPVRVSIARLIIKLNVTRICQAQYEWWNYMRKLDITMRNPDKYRIYITDFGVTLNFGAAGKTTAL